MDREGKGVQMVFSMREILSSLMWSLLVRNFLVLRMICSRSLRPLFSFWRRLYRREGSEDEGRGAKGLAKDRRANAYLFAGAVHRLLVVVVVVGGGVVGGLRGSVHLDV